MSRRAWANLRVVRPTAWCWCLPSNPPYPPHPTPPRRAEQYSTVHNSSLLNNCAVCTLWSGEHDYNVKCAEKRDLNGSSDLWCRFSTVGQTLYIFVMMYFKQSPATDIIISVYCNYVKLFCLTPVNTPNTWRLFLSMLLGGGGNQPSNINCTSKNCK